MVRRRDRRAPRQAFTLMELLVVVAILVMLAGIGGVIYTKYLDDARRSRALIDVRMLTEVAQTYQVKYGDYPASLAALTATPPDGGTPYVEPRALIDPWGHEYQYAVPGQHHAATGKPDVWSQGARAGDASGVVGNWMER